MSYDMELNRRMVEAVQSKGYSVVGLPASTNGHMAHTDRALPIDFKDARCIGRHGSEGVRSQQASILTRLLERLLAFSVTSIGRAMRRVH